MLSQLTFANFNISTPLQLTQSMKKANIACKSSLKKQTQPRASSTKAAEYKKIGKLIPTRKEMELNDKRKLNLDERMKRNVELEKKKHYKVSRLEPGWTDIEGIPEARYQIKENGIIAFKFFQMTGIEVTLRDIELFKNMDHNQISLMVQKNYGGQRNSKQRHTIYALVEYIKCGLIKIDGV